MVVWRSWLKGGGRGRFLESRLTVLVKTVVDKVSCVGAHVPVFTIVYLNDQLTDSDL